MIIFGIKFWAWGSSTTQRIWKCWKCGFEGQFIEKKGMNFITLYFVIPTIPVSGVKTLVECPRCKTRYEDNPNNTSAPPPIANP
ncbi:hypothetical protein EON83_04970 [bacterium]|nr:MAG: hypothetical protein EON83_04970 [bacterium]